MLLPIGVNLLLTYLMFIWFPSANDSTTWAMFLFLPETSVIFLACTLVNVLSVLIRARVVNKREGV